MSNLLVQNIKHTNGTTAQTIDSSGNTTLSNSTTIANATITNATVNGKIKGPEMTRFIAHSDQSGNTSYSAGQAFVCNLTTVNVNNRYNTSNGIFVADVDGYYAFTHSVYVYNTGQISVLKWDGSSLGYYTADGGSDHTVLVTATVANQIYGFSWAMHLDSGEGCAVGWRNGYSGGSYRPHMHFSGHLVFAD